MTCTSNCPSGQPKPETNLRKPFGSGYFGEWIEDDFGLPAYRYTCDQTVDPKAVTPVNPAWRSPTDHSHQVGNDRLVAVASNYGTVQVRQDEGGPKFLNDDDPAHHLYAGGFGYLTDGQISLSTFFPGKADSFERIFGTGYYRKTVRRAGYSADQVIFAPFGDDPLLISQVEVTNHRSTPADLRWIEVWGCQIYPFSFRAAILSTISLGKWKIPDLRRGAARRYTHHFSTIGERDGLLDQKTFRGYPAIERAAWGIAQLIMATAARKITGGPVRPPVKEAALEDSSPPPTFLVSLDAPADGLGTDEAAFFGGGTAATPYGLDRQLPPPGKGNTLFLEREIHLEPGESRTCYFAYGYLPKGVALEPLLARYRQDPTGLWEKSCASWKNGRIRLDLPDEAWVDRELTWHQYYLRSNLTYDSFYQEHILSQGQVYQYLMGLQGAARDPLQHALPFIFTRPEIVREILRYTLKEVLPDGEIPYSMCGTGMRAPLPYRPSDQELWLLWLASEYILSTRDQEFLNEEIPTYPLYGPPAGRATVRQMLARCYHHLNQITGTGRHGLLRLSNGDWNDAIVVGFVPKNREDEARKQGESVLNAAVAGYVFDLYAQMLAYTGEPELSVEASQHAEQQRQAVREQWTGQWFLRAWLGDRTGWLGEDELWLEPQPWAILGGAATGEQREVLVRAIHERLREPSPIGAMLLDREVPKLDYTGKGIWPAINGPLIWALAQVDGRLAWEEWRKNSLAWHAEVYPEVWYGIWSGPDVLNSVLSKHPGETYYNDQILKGEVIGSLSLGVNWTDFPVMNMHPHAWPLYSLTRLMGLRFSPVGLELAPCLPKPAYRFESPLFGLEKFSHGYSGWYAPLISGEWQVALCLPEEELSRMGRLVVNGQAQPFVRTPDGSIHWSGESRPGEPLRWEIVFSSG